MADVWRKSIASWEIKRDLYLSIPFTWLIPEARELAKKHKGDVITGGPGAYLMREEVSKWARVEEEVPFTCPLNFHNPLATFTTRGCVNKCKFCAVPIIEGEFRELKKWEPRPYVCDNNFLAASKKHIEKAVDSLRMMPFVDFNQGLDVRLLKQWHLDEIARLKGVKLRFAFDHTNEEGIVSQAIKNAKAMGFKRIGIYVLIGFRDTPEEAKYKLDKVLEWRCIPSPMRYQPLDCLEKNSYVGENWTAKELKKMTRYYFRQRYFGGIPYEEFQSTKEEPNLERLF